MYVNMLQLKAGEQTVIAVIRMADGQLQVDGEMPPRIRATLDFEHEHFKERHGGGDEAFLRRLPQVFSGTYLRAQFVA